MPVEWVSKGARRFRPFIGWPALILAIAAVWLAALGVMEADWVDGDLLFLYAAVVSAFLSVILAHTRLKGHWAVLLFTGLGLLYVGNSLAHFVPPPLGALRELGAGAIWLVLFPRQPELSPPAFPLWIESGARLATFGDRLASWGFALIGGQSERNPVAFLFVSGLIIWGSAAWAMWIIVRRGRPLLAMLPLGVVLSMSTYLSASPVGYLVAFVACMILLLPLVNLGWQERKWERAGIDYSTEIRFDVWQVAFAIMIVFLILAIVTPSFSIPRLVNTFWKFISRPQQAIEDVLIRFFGGVEPAPPPPITVKGGSGASRTPPDASLPRAHLLGGNPGLTTQVVMYVCTDAPPPIPEDLYPEEFELTGPKYYWKGTTYDTYLGRQWTNGLHRTVVVPAYDPVIESVVTPTLSLKQRYLIEVAHRDTLYAAGEAHVVDQQVESRQRMVDDLVGLQGSTNDYVVDSLVPQATVRQMIAVSETYPSYIESRYLQLPSDLPERVRTLALEVVRDLDSNYEKALAIESYLRQFPYDLKVPVPPQGRDVVDYFLFDAQRGYCDYYASSFVILARVAGIPARLAVGYAMGGFSPSNGCYVVVEMDAHSWPELYFGEHGWVPFEPTAAFRTFERPDDPVQPANLVPLPRSAPPRPWYIAVHEWWRRVRQDWTTYVSIGGGFVLLILLIVWGERARRRQRLSPVEGIALCYEEMSRMGERLGTMRRPYDTPAEYATILTDALYARQARWPWSARKVMPALEEAGRGVRTLSRAYERASYSTLLNPPAQRSQVDRLWRGLQRQLRWLRYSSQHPATAGD